VTGGFDLAAGGATAPALALAAILAEHIGGLI